VTGPFDRLCELLQEEAAALKVRGTWNAEQRDPQQAAADWLAAAAVEGLVLALSGALSRWLEELGEAEDILGPGDDPA
jgi:hypothetical protein